MASGRRTFAIRAFSYAGLAVLFLVSVAYFTIGAFDRIDGVLHASERVRAPFDLGDGNWGAIALQPEARAAGMKFADGVLAVNGHSIDGFLDYYGVLRKARVGNQLLVRIQRSLPDGNPAREVSIELRPYSNNSNTVGLSAYVDIALRMVTLPVVCLALGFWVAAVRVRDRSAWLLLVVLLGLAASVSGGGNTVGLFGRDNILQPILIGFRGFLGNIMPAALMFFGVVFPERLALDRRLPFLKWIIGGYLALVAGLVSISSALWLHHLTWAREMQRPIGPLTGANGDFSAAVSVVAMVGCVGSLGWKTFTSSARDARRRLLLLDVGAVASVAALLTIVVTSRWKGGLPRSAYFPLLAMLLAFPAAMAYGILVQRAMDVRVVIRQGVQYVLATGGVRVLQVAISVAIVIVAAVMDASTSMSVRVAFISVGLVLLAGIQGSAQRLRRWIDRRFFREAYEADTILSDLAAKARTMVETGPLLETVAHRIAESLHVARIAILLDERGAFRPAYALGYAVPPTAMLSVQSLTANRLRAQQRALVEFGDADSWVQMADDEERAALEQLKPELLLPLSLNDNVLGIMCLGPKQSEEPFSSTDIRLLDSVAAQTGLALENGRLTEVIKSEVAAREKQKRELEIAREVQERLFPQELVPFARLDYDGACRPALSVGGDYYDFIPLSKTTLGIAIGDVSGKGIPAALLMATLRAFLRGQTVHENRDLPAVIGNLNKLVYDSSAENRYATFFYGEYDATTRSLTYVNAGHNPPMVFRQGSGDRAVTRLDAGGMVVGLMDDCVYGEGCVTLAAGDVLVAYTDGISEAMNSLEEEWGEERLMDAVRRDPITSASTLIERVMTAADAFVSGAPQHDDMTLVVLRTM